MNSFWEQMLLGTWETVYMTIVSTFFGYVLGLPLGLALNICHRNGLHPQRTIYRVVDIITNVARSIPFLILMVIVIPISTFIVGRSYGSTATIVPLVLGAAPFIARLVESSLNEVDKGVIEATISMGASTWQIIWKVLLVESRTSLLIGVTITLCTILGYSAMAGAIGGGGLGAIAIQYGYYRYDSTMMWSAVALIIFEVQILQIAGMFLARKLDHRKIH